MYLIHILHRIYRGWDTVNQIPKTLTLYVSVPFTIPYVFESLQTK